MTAIQQLNTFNKIKHFIALTIPIILTQFAITGGSFVSVVLTGQYSTVDLAGISVGFNLWTACYYGIIGIHLGISPIIAQLLGAKEKDNIPTIIYHGLILSVCFFLLMILLGLTVLDPILTQLQLEPTAYEVCWQYLKAIAVGLFPLILTCVLRNTLDCHGYTHYTMYIILCGLGLHIFLDYALILGHFGFPALGGLGAGIATAIAYWFNFLAFLCVLILGKPFKEYRLFRHPFTFDLAYIQEQLRLGIPIGLAIFAESSIFSLAGIAATAYGTSIIAAHQAALSFTSLFYGVPLSIGIAATITVGYAVGAKQLHDAKVYSYIARGLAVVLAMTICLYTFTHLPTIAGYYTNDPNMVDLIGSFLSYAVFFTVIDALGTPIQGILRGYKDVRIISIIALSSFCGTSIPIAAIFTFIFNYGPYAIWIGLLGSTLIAAMLFTWRVWFIQNKKNKQLDISYV